VPTSEEVGKNGIELSDMTSILLRKVEELTLYLIEQKKRTDQLEDALRLKKKPLTFN
jgi:hypothetical protein